MSQNNDAKLKRMILRISIFCLAISAPSAWALFDLKTTMACEPGWMVYVDCKIHKITFFDSMRRSQGASDIDCGNPNGPYAQYVKNGIGRVGRALDPVADASVIDMSKVGYGVDIDIPGMGSKGGGQVFHLTPPLNSGNVPSKADKSWGCIHVTQNVLDSLGRCNGAALYICNSGGVPGCGEGTSTPPISGDSPLPGSSQ